VRKKRPIQDTFRQGFANVIVLDDPAMRGGGGQLAFCVGGARGWEDVPEGFGVQPSNVLDVPRELALEEL